MAKPSTSATTAQAQESEQDTFAQETLNTMCSTEDRVCRVFFFLLRRTPDPMAGDPV